MLAKLLAALAVLVAAVTAPAIIPDRQSAQSGYPMPAGTDLAAPPAPTMEPTATPVTLPTPHYSPITSRPYLPPADYTPDTPTPQKGYPLP